MRSITTKRLVLTPFKVEDLDLFLRINTDPFVREYLWDDTIIEQEMAQEILAVNHSQFEQNQLGLWKIQIVGEADTIGYAGLWYFFDEPQPQLIYALLPRFSKQGYATEAAQAVIDYAFNKLGFSYLIAAMDEPHLVSQKVAERLGMAFTEKRITDDKPTLFYRINKT